MTGKLQVQLRSGRGEAGKLKQNKDEELPEAYTIAAMMQLLVGDIKRHIELNENELNIYAEMRTCVMKWAVLKKAWKRKKARCDAGRRGRRNEESDWRRQSKGKRETVGVIAVPHMHLEQHMWAWS